MQERVESGLTKSCIEHQPVERFVINTHGFHNAHLLRTAVPRSLIAPIPFFLDRWTKHVEIAVGLRATQDVKRTAAKARAVQKKRDAVDVPDKIGPVPNKRARLEMERADLNGEMILT
jgi:hypothetical protein